MRVTTFLKLHEGLLSGKIRLNRGLCALRFNGGELGDNEIFQLFQPSYDEAIGIRHFFGFWGDTLNEPWMTIGTKYNDFRQTVILLCAAINGEL